jgi:hypothetical protein
MRPVFRMGSEALVGAVFAVLIGVYSDSALSMVVMGAVSGALVFLIEIINFRLRRKPPRN